MQNRLKSWATWLSISTLIGFVAKTYFGWEIPMFNQLVDMILLTLTAFGILNNPTDPAHF